MAETVVENQICNVCSVDVRKGALFCYHCGNSVAPEIIAPQTDKIDDENQPALKKDFTENGQKASRMKLKDESVIVKEIEEKPIPKPAIQPETKLKSAASLRKNQPKVVKRKKVEIIWEEHENAPNVWFISAAILLTVFAAVVMWLALSFG